MAKRIIGFVLLFMLLFVPLSYGETVDPISIDKNQTIPVDYGKLYNDTKIKLTKYETDYQIISLEKEWILSNNIITYYYDNGIYPYPDKYVSSYLSHNPDYGENETYLGQVVDSYFNDDNVNGTHQTEYNSSLDCMELKIGSAGMIIENFSTYTEVDTGSNRIQFVNDTYVTHVAHRQEDTYLYYDYGVDFINEYECSFETYLSSGPDYSMGVPFLVSNYINSYWKHITNNKAFASLRFYESSPGDPQHLYLAYWNTTSAQSDSFDPASEDTWYYINMVQYEKNLTCFIYSDREHLNLVDTLSVAHWATGYRYLYALNSFGYTSGTNIAVYWNRNMRIWEGVGYSDGHYYTTELLNGDRAITLMYNASIPTNTDITVEFSIDNSTWVNHNNGSGYDSLVDGFESIDLRDLNTTSLYIKISMTTTNPEITPRMYQVRLITITDVETGKTLMFLMPVGITITLICTIVILVKRRK